MDDLQFNTIASEVKGVLSIAARDTELWVRVA